ncbi:UNVERIFIED_CONTAM: hypothetical protein K2H54_037008 [Gekko kuhli]
MKVLLSLSFLCITLALCHAACFLTLPKAEIRNGVIVPQESCIDPYDRSKHPSGSQWNTDHCLRCTCSRGEMECCHRYGGVARGPKGCEAVVNPETCRHEFHRTGNPSEPCF